MSEFNVDLNVARSTDKGPIIQGEKGEVVKYLVLGALYALMFTVMVSCNGWRMGMGIAVALFAPLIIFGGLFWLCGCRSNYCCNTAMVAIGTDFEIGMVQNIQNEVAIRI